MADLNDQKGFDAVEDLISKAVSMHALEPDKFEMLYRRLYTEVPVFPPVTLSSDTPKAPHMSSDLSIYDDLLKGRKSYSIFLFRVSSYDCLSDLIESATGSVFDTSEVSFSG